MKAPYEIWLWLAKRFLRRRCLKSVDDGRRWQTDNGVCLYYKWALANSADQDQTCRVWSASTIFSYRSFYLKQNKNGKNTTDTPKIGNGLVQLIRMDWSTRYIWVKLVNKHDKTNQMSVRPAKTQIILGICPVWSVFAVRMKEAWVLSYPLSAQQRLIRLGGCPGWSESSLGAQPHCWFCSCRSSNSAEVVQMWALPWLLVSMKWITLFPCSQK